MAPRGAHAEARPFDLRLRTDSAAGLMVVHGSPRSTREGFHLDLADAETSEIIGSETASVVVCAHTHKAGGRRVQGRRIVNVGSVGAPFNRDPRAQYGLFELATDGTWAVRLKAVEYDRTMALRAFSSSGYLDAGVAAHIFRCELDLATSRLYAFERWSEQSGRAKDLAAWRDFDADSAS